MLADDANVLENSPSTAEIRAVAVIGAGTMGSGITQVVAESGRPVTMIDVSPDAVARGVATMERNWSRGLEKGRVDLDFVERARANVATSTDWTAVTTADLVIEAVFESLDAKTVVFREVAPLIGSTAILASNTSSISITKLAAVTDLPDRVVGMHFFNPVPVMQLVEVVRGERTAPATVAAVTLLARALGKTPVEVNDFPGFVSNRVLLPMINEAIFCLSDGVATREAIDTVLRLGMAHPMGPLTLADLIGLDVCLDILEVLHRDLGDDKYRPAPLLRRLVAAGKLGRKTGEGFYQYDAQ